MQIAPTEPPPSKVVKSGIDSILSTKWIWLSILCFAMFKHAIITVYLTTQGILNATQDDAEKRAGYIYEAKTVALVFFLLSVLHVCSIFHVCWRLRCKSKPFKRPSKPVQQVKVHPEASTGGQANAFRWTTSYSNLIVLFNLVEIMCQSYEAIEFAAKVPDRTIVGLYIFLVVLHAVLTPLLFVFRHSVAKVLLTNVLLSWISLALSCLIHFFALIVPLLYYKFVDSNVAKDPQWLVKFVLYVQYNTVTSPIDFGAKSVMQLGALVTLWRLQGLAIKYFSNPPDGREIASNSAMAGTASSKRINRGLSIYLSCSVLWGVVLFGSLIQALWIRQPCPPTCQASLLNLWDSNCQCMFVDVNCVKMGSQDVDSALQSSQLGAKLYGIQVSQCDLYDGIPNATLHQFPGLSYVAIHFTKTKAWDGQLPHSMVFFTASYNMFSSVPAILDRELPPSLVTFRFMNQPIASPLVIPKTWNVASKMDLTNVSFSASTNFSTFSLVALGLAFNNLTQLPTSIASMASLTGLDLSGNVIPSVPWNLLDKGIPVLLCGNPLRDANRPDLLQTYQTSLAKYCEPLCAPHCFPYMVGNYNCDLACFNAACRYDGGDCHAFELNLV
ncbi:hypothetical protein AC1031_016996 [Aphanomyces cochlioides]|nr:hypothetical protein AC1031_016996 [Aphanomyces cochlioides]